MNSLINLVISIVLNLLSSGTHQPVAPVVSNSQTIQVCQEKSYQLTDLRSNYLITKEEVSRNLVNNQVEIISTN